MRLVPEDTMIDEIAIKTPTRFFRYLLLVIFLVSPGTGANDLEFQIQEAYDDGDLAGLHAVLVWREIGDGNRGRATINEIGDNEIGDGPRLRS